MIQFKSLRQYTHVVDGIRFPQKVTEPFFIVYFSENSSLINDYPKLGIRPIDCKIVIVPLTKIPRTWMHPDTKKLFKTYGLYAFSSQQKTPVGKNLFFDPSQYLNAIDSTYKATNYRQRAGFLIKNVLQRAFEKYPGEYQKVLMYSVNISKGLSPILNRKVFPILQQLKDEDLYFDHMILTLVDETSSRHRLIIKDREFMFPRIYQIIKAIKLRPVDEESEKEVKETSKEVIDNIAGDIAPSNRRSISGAIADFMSKSPKNRDIIASKLASKDDFRRIAIAAILYKSNNDISKSEQIAKSILKKNISKALRAVDKNYADEMLEPQKPVTTSSDLTILMNNLSKAVDEKTPEHLFQKRQVDFKKNLRKDLENSFRMLEKKDKPLMFKNLKVVDKVQSRGELNQSDVETIVITLSDKSGKEFDVKIDTPKIDPKTGTFRVYGKKKCLINQIILCPITFPKLYESKFESSYSKFRIHSKRTKRLKYLETYLGSYHLPLLIVLAYSFGFDEILKEYKIKYSIVDVKPKVGEKFVYKVNNNSYIKFSDVNTELKEELCASFEKAKVHIYDIEDEFGTKKYFDSLIKEMTGRVSSTWLINIMLENIVDPVAKQVLINKQLPSELQGIMNYMATKVVEGYVEDRNDISNQRVRGSETIVHLAQKMLLAAHTEYREQILSGNKDAEFKINQGKVLTDFNLLEIVQDMEYSNPVEEMAVMTRITPIGKSVGGIPDRQAIQVGARGTHNSYFGNIDPLDTPESEPVGIIQQLTVNAYITSARGLFLQKELSDKEGSGILSTTACLTPFIETNDGARVIMLAAQQKQVVPLKNPEPPIVQSGYESLLPNVLSDNFMKRSPCNGKVVEVTDDHIIIQCTKGGKQKIPVIPVHLRSGSGKDTLSVFKPAIKKGQSVKEGSVLAEGSCIANGSIAMGRTLCVAVMPYKGYTFEDSLVISESLVQQEKLTSQHGIIEDVIISEKDRLMFICNIGDKVAKGGQLLRKTIGELEELLGVDEDAEGIEYAGGQMIKKSPGGVVVDIEVFSNVEDDKFPQLTQLIRRTRRIHGMTAKDKITIRGKSVAGVLVRLKIEQELSINLGDKLTNRFGAKGTVGLIEKEELMPRTPWGDQIEFIINPISIIGRMNVGQLFEMYTGLISKTLASQILTMKTKTQVLALFKKVFILLDGSEKQKLSSAFLNNFSRLSDAKFKAFMKQIKDSGFVPIVVPPFKSPPHQNIKQALKILGLKTGYHLTLPEFNTKTKNAVPVGYMYINKLEHISEAKAHARSTGPVTGKTRQPTAGKRREGGQRMGEMDTYSLISYNCPTVLAEFFGPLSDDHVTKNEIIADIIQKGNAEYRVPKVSPARDLLNSYMVSLVLSR